MNEWREFLYPIGFLASILFGARILTQWVNSEIKQTSTVSKLFWQLSVIGNVLLLIHSLIQVQYHVFFIQIGNAMISWRNINLMGKRALSLKSTITLFTTAFIGLSLFFFVFNGLNGQDFSTWFRIPVFSLLQKSSRPVNDMWHVMGFIGLTLFSSRFWIQWISAEKKKTSYLGPSFWWISLIGDLMILVYFAKIKDPVNLIGPVLGLIPYVRNLMLIKKVHNE